jgi:hypothetical protein
MTNREKLIADLDEYFKDKHMNIGTVTNFILADRKRIVQPIEEVLKNPLPLAWQNEKMYKAAMEATLNNALNS